MVKKSNSSCDLLEKGFQQTIADDYKTIVCYEAATVDE